MSPFTRRRVSAGLAVVLSTGVVALASAAFADGGTTATAVMFKAETWYEPDPTCMLPTGCVGVGAVLPPVNPYGAGTLHVGVTAGTSGATETARTYLTLPAVTLGAGSTLTGAAFVAPLDTSSTDGSVAPDTSTTHVCTTNGTIAANEGEFDDPPSTLCSTDADLTYVATPTPELTGDLTEVLNANLSDLAAGKLSLAIIPLNAPATATWSDVFSADDRTSSGPATPTLQLTFSSSTSAAPVVVTDSASPTPVDGASASSAPTAPAVTTTVRTAAPVSVAPAPGTVTIAAAPAAAPVTAVVPAPAAAEPSVVPTPEVASSAVATDQAPVSNNAPAQTVQTVASTRTVGFAYPAVLLLPVILIAGGAGLARIMTRDLTPTSDRTQA